MYVCLDREYLRENIYKTDKHICLQGNDNEQGQEENEYCFSLYTLLWFEFCHMKLMTKGGTNKGDIKEHKFFKG